MCDCAMFFTHSGALAKYIESSRIESDWMGPTHKHTYTVPHSLRPLAASRSYVLRTATTAIECNRRKNAIMSAKCSNSCGRAERLVDDGACVIDRRARARQHLSIYLSSTDLASTFTCNHLFSKSPHQFKNALLSLAKHFV